MMASLLLARLTTYDITNILIVVIVDYDKIVYHSIRVKGHICKIFGELYSIALGRMAKNPFLQWHMQQGTYGT